MNLSIPVFCYNEEQNLQPLTEKLLNILPLMAESWEIIIVNDGSTDATGRIAEEVSRLNPLNIRVIHHPANSGIGMALYTGYSSAKYEYICAIPGDGQFDVELLKQVKPFGKSEYYSFYRTETHYNLFRKLLTWGNRFFNQHILAVILRDVNWIKVYRRDQLDLANPRLRSSLIESEICAKLYKCKIMPIEIPSQYLPRRHGVPKGGAWKTLRKVFKEMIPLWWEIITFTPPTPVK